MKRILIALAAALLTLPAAAENSPFCQELWLSRNAVMDRAGQCFTSPLGQAVFDNSDCVEGEIRLNPLDAEIVRLAQEGEGFASCTVDTEAERLLIDVLPFHARLMEVFTIPVRADSEHGCQGYEGPPTPLHAGISTNMTVIGVLMPGQNFSLSHAPMRGGWEYLEVRDAEGVPVAHGWTQNTPEDLEAACAFSAG